VKPGAWVYNLGGWTIDQFADDNRPFTREELDAIAPENPVLLQASYYEAYLNSRALQVLAIDNKTGRIDEAGVRPIAARLPAASAIEIEASTVKMIGDLNRAGLTSFGSAGCEADVLPIYNRMADQGKLNVRVSALMESAPAQLRNKSIERCRKSRR
jgi:predicted amidohydrolase YtcJ